jgi:hypothetical protein
MYIFTSIFNCNSSGRHDHENKCQEEGGIKAFLKKSNSIQEKLKLSLNLKHHAMKKYMGETVLSILNVSTTPRSVVCFGIGEEAR